jgi:Holliday junction resolvasome RuvABC endonuclease subunit
VRLLGIDPGTSCGYAILETETGHIVSGVWDLSSRRHEGGGMRYLRLRSHLLDIFAAGIDAVGYEEVRHHIGTDAAHVYGGIVATISSTCEDQKVDVPRKLGFAPFRPAIPYQGIPVGTIKKFATGKGNAKKPEIVEAANRLWPTAFIQDDNEADARFIAMVLARNIGEDRG